MRTAVRQVSVDAYHAHQASGTLSAQERAIVQFLARAAGAPTRAEIAAGAVNTEAMAAAGSKLATQIRALRTGDFDDWYLPSRLESLLLFGELRDQFDQDWYWTSTQYERSSDSAWVQNFYYGFQSFNHKGTHCRGRAVRSIVIE